MTSLQGGSQAWQANQVSLTLRSIKALEPGLLPCGLDWLSEAEKLRLATFTTPRRRAQFVSGRWLARQCLAARAGGAWQDYMLSAPEIGAPAVMAVPVDAVPAPWHFSLSHSGDWLACAVASQPVGVDVECNTPVRDFEAFNELIHKPSALGMWRSMSAEEQRIWFYAQWTLKEAWLKWAMASSTSPTIPSIASVEFKPRAQAAADALSGWGKTMTLAVYPATIATLQADLHPDSPIEWSAWSTH